MNLHVFLTFGDPLIVRGFQSSDRVAKLMLCWRWLEAMLWLGEALFPYAFHILTYKAPLLPWAELRVQRCMHDVEWRWQLFAGVVVEHARANLYKRGSESQKQKCIISCHMASILRSLLYRFRIGVRDDTASRPTRFCGDRRWC